MLKRKELKRQKKTKQKNKERDKGLQSELSQRDREEVQCNASPV